jgi:hypothetical protein
VTEPTEDLEKDYLFYIENLVRNGKFDLEKLGIPNEQLSKSFHAHGPITRHEIRQLVSETRQIYQDYLESLEATVQAARVQAARVARESAQTGQKESKPPRLAEYCISFLAPENTAQALLGDLQEMFQENVRRLGEKEARRKYWMQVVASARPLVWTWIKRIGLFTAFVDYVRSKFGL